MIISPNRRFVFVHVHKCAGTSIETSLAEVLGVNDLVIGSTADGEKHKTFFFELLKLRKHSSAAEAREVLGEARWKTYFTFAFVRHPVDRLRSLYAYARGLAARNPLDANEAAAFRANGALPARVPYKFKAVQAAFTAKDFDAFVRNPRVWQDAGAKPQWQAVCDAEGEQLVDFIGKVEHIDRDWDKVAKRLKISATLGVQNKSPQVDPQDLSPEAWALIRKHYLRDFKLFGYAVPPDLAAAKPPGAKGAGGKPAAKPAAKPL